jgi:hypothetical protein
MDWSIQLLLSFMYFFWVPIVVDIDLGAALSATLSDTGDLVTRILLGAPGALADLLDLDVGGLRELELDDENGERF